MIPARLLVLSLFFAAPSAAGERRFCPDRLPLHRETEIQRNLNPAAVVLIPKQAEYARLAEELVAAIARKTGVTLPIQSAADYVEGRSRAIRTEQLQRHFILIGQFWNNAVLERLYARGCSAADAVYPGPGGCVVRTVCSPFRHGHNCVVATGSDLEGCGKAVARLTGRIRETDRGHCLPYLLEVELSGEAEDDEKRFQEDPRLGAIELYTTFGHPEGRVWRDWGNPHNYAHWTKEAMRAATYFGFRYWLTGDRRHARVFMAFLQSAIANDKDADDKHMPGIEYGFGDLPIAWDLIEESDVFTEDERRRVNGFLNKTFWRLRDAYFNPKCLDVPLEELRFHGRHQYAGSFWFGAQAEWLLRSFRLEAEQREFARRQYDNTARFLKRLLQTPFYSDGPQLTVDDAWLVLRYALRTGDYDFARESYLRPLADYFVALHDNLGGFTANGHHGGDSFPPVGDKILNIAGWMMPNEGYLWYRRRLAACQTTFFAWHTLAYRWESPLADQGAERLKSRHLGVFVLPVGDPWSELVRQRPTRFFGGYRRVFGRYAYDPVATDRTFKRLILRNGFERRDQYFMLDGQQGFGWSYDDANAVVRYNDRGASLLATQHGIADRLRMNSLLASNGAPGGQQSVQAEVAAAADLGPEALVAVRVPRSDGLAWTRSVFWRKGAWFLVADTIVPPKGGPHRVVQTWLGRMRLRVDGPRAAGAVGDAALTLTSTPDRPFHAVDGSGVRQAGNISLARGRAATFWTLLAAADTRRDEVKLLQRISPDAVLVQEHNSMPKGRTTERRWIAFRKQLRLDALSIEADLGLVSSDRLTLAGCRVIRMDDKQVWRSQDGIALGWDLASNRFETGKQGYALQASDELAVAASLRSELFSALRRALARAGRGTDTAAVETAADPLNAVPLLRSSTMKTLRTPVSLAVADLDGDGGEELVLYDTDGAARFAYPQFIRSPVACDLDGEGKLDIAFVVDGRKIEVHHADGALRWRKTVTADVGAMAAGDFDGDGREDLGLGQHSWASVHNHAGEEIYAAAIKHYESTACAFSDLDGDGRCELVVASSSAVNVCRLGQGPRWHHLAQYFQRNPCRLWVRDFNKDGRPEGYLGGGGSDPGGYDLRDVRMRWTFGGMPVHPRDVSLFDTDADGRPEMIAACEDGFLYVIDTEGGRFCFSSLLDPGVCRLATVCGERGPSGVLAAGLETGRVVFLDRKLAPLARARVGANPVLHVAVLKSLDDSLHVIAADSSGLAIEIDPSPLIRREASR